MKKSEKETTRIYIERYKYLRVLILIVTLGIFIWGLAIPRGVTSYNEKSFSTVNQGWIQNIDEKEIAIGEISDFIFVDTSEKIILEHIVEPEMIGKSLVFYAEHQEVSVTVEDKNLYTLECPQKWIDLGSPGHTWVKAYISDDLLGKVLQIKLQSDFTLFHGGPTSVYSLSENEIYFLQRDFFWVNHIIAIIVLFLAIITYVNAFIWEEHMLHKYLFAMADVYLFVAAWIFSEVSILSMWTGRIVLSTIMSMVFIRIIPIAFYQFFRISMPYTSWRIKTMGVMVWGNFIGTLVAQFVFGISLVQLLSVQTVVLIVMCGLVFVELIYYYRNARKYDVYNKELYFIAIIPVAALVEIYICCDYFLRKQWIGVSLGGACILYSLIAHVFLVREETHTKTKKGNLETEYNNLHKKPLNQQINAHFLFNSLNTISTYCKQDPILANKMVVLLAKYMRKYMKFMGASEYVELEEELELTQDYIDIQNMRFENSIEFHIENNCDKVMLPPLVLQPMVENAVNHGFKNNWHCGEIIIRAYYKCNYVEIIVSDNGSGFDTQNIKSESGIGLMNVKSRMNAMGGGIRIESELEKGTTVTLWVPINNGIDKNASK